MGLLFGRARWAQRNPQRTFYAVHTTYFVQRHAQNKSQACFPNSCQKCDLRGVHHADGTPRFDKSSDLPRARKGICAVSTAQIVCTCFQPLFEQFSQKLKFARQVRHLRRMCFNTSRHRRAVCSCPHTHARHRYRNACFGRYAMIRVSCEPARTEPLSVTTSAGAR